MGAHPAPLSDAAPVRVLIADDTEDVRDLLKLVLSLDGRFEVVGEAGDGREAVLAASSLQPDAVVLDLAMPVMDGLQALPEIRRQVPDAKIVVLSGFSARKMATEVRSLGADAYLEKGGAFKELPPLLSRLCHTRSRGRDGERVAAVEGGARVFSSNGDRRIGALPGDEAAELLAFVSHELQNPITVIQGFAATLVHSVDRLEHEVAISAAGAIERQARHLAEMVRAFAEARLVEVGGVDLRRERVDLGGLVRQMTADLSPITDPHPVVVSVIPVVALADPGRVREIIANLLSNAAKFTPREAAIEIEVQATGSEARIEVRDRCDGIPHGREDELFRKFSRPLTTASGTGLGLYISRGIARAHGGDLSYVRRDGGGCRFILTLPL